MPLPPELFSLAQGNFWPSSNPQPSLAQPQTRRPGHEPAMEPIWAKLYRTRPGLRRRSPVLPRRRPSVPSTIPPCSYKMTRPSHPCPSPYRRLPLPRGRCSRSAGSRRLSSPPPHVSPPLSSSRANRCHHHVHLAEMEPARRFPSTAVHRNPIAAESARRPPWRTAAAPSKSGNSRPSPPPVSTNP
jgi:hypothetical protein